MAPQVSKHMRQALLAAFLVGIAMAISGFALQWLPPFSAVDAGSAEAEAVGTVSDWLAVAGIATSIASIVFSVLFTPMPARRSGTRRGR